jgi:hypothetical protein
MLSSCGVKAIAVRGTALALSMALSAACTPSTCDRSEDANPLTRYTQGTVTDGVYASATPDGETSDGETSDGGLLYFPGGMRYAIEHKLGGPPRWWQLYLSFDRYGTKNGTLTQASGNQAEVVCVDKETLNVVNGSCSEYWLRVVAGDPDDDAGDPDDDPDAAKPPLRCAPATR